MHMIMALQGYHYGHCYGEKILCHDVLYIAVSLFATPLDSSTPPWASELHPSGHVVVCHHLLMNPVPGKLERVLLMSRTGSLGCARQKLKTTLPSAPGWIQS